MTAEISEVALTSIAHELRLAAQALAHRVREHTPVLPPHLFSILFNLEHGPATGSDLAERARVSNPTMSRSITELEERGFVRRDVDPADARQKFVFLTPDGRAALLQGRRERDAYMADLLRSCSTEELLQLRELTGLLRRVAES